MDIKTQLQNYTSIFAEEELYKSQILNFLDSAQLPYHRINDVGHFTASGFLLNSDRTKFLLMHHKKLDQWFQPGGHCDGSSDLLQVAIRETIEESGIAEIAPIILDIYDIDVHLIPANAKEKEHYHYDIRFLLKTAGNDTFNQNEESNELRWIDIKDYANSDVEFNHSIERMVKKYIKLEL